METLDLKVNLVKHAEDIELSLFIHKCHTGLNDTTQDAFEFSDGHGHAMHMQCGRLCVQEVCFKRFAKTVTQLVGCCYEKGSLIARVSVSCHLGRQRSTSKKTFEVLRNGLRNFSANSWRTSHSKERFQGQSKMFWGSVKP